MRRLYFTINNQPYSINDLEDGELNLAFIEFYRIYLTTDREYVENALKKFLPRLFELSEKFLASQKGKFDFHDAYFNNFTIFTENSWRRGFGEQASRIWNEVHKFIAKFEEKNFKIHKGSLYYFWAVSLFVNDKIEEALLALHKAVLEDKQNKPQTWKSAPGYLFLTLNDQVPGPYFKEYIDYAAGFIRDRLDGQGNEKGRYKNHYVTTRGGKLDYTTFRSKFLGNDQIDDEIKFYFVYAVLRLWYLRKLKKRGLGEQVFAPLIFSSYLGALLLVWENLFRVRAGGKEEELGTFLPQFVKKLKLPTIDLGKENEYRKTNFRGWLVDNLDKGIREDLIIGHGLRNHAAHTIASEELLWENDTKVLQSVMNCIFVLLENL